MTLEEILEFFKTEEGKAAHQSIIEEATEGLKNKNNELIQKNKILKTAKETAEAKIIEMDEEILDITAGKGKGKDLATEIEKKLEKKFEKQLKDANDKNDKYSKQINTLVVENGLTEALTKANIAKQHIPAVKALIKSTSKIEVSSEDDDDAPVATIGGKALSDYVKEFAEGDSGKHYVAAANNSGGGSQGSNGNADGKVDTSKLSPREKINHARASAKK
jgi:hypothetical protein